MIECKICGKQFKNTIVYHIKKEHNISTKEYSEKYGNVYSQEYSQKISNNAKRLWKTKNYREKQKEKAKIKFTESVRNKMSSVKIEGYRNNKYKIWCKGLTKETDHRLFCVAENNRKLFSGRTKKDYEYLQKHSEWAKKESTFVKNNPVKNFSIEKKKEWREKISKTLTDNITNGKIKCTSYHFKSGEFITKTGIHYHYDSSFELEMMKLLNKSDLNWIKNNTLKIEYNKKDGTKSNYIPDFIINLKEKTIIVETKGFPDENIYEKLVACKRLYPDTRICFSIKDIHNTINSILKLSTGKN